MKLLFASFLTLKFRVNFKFIGRTEGLTDSLEDIQMMV